MSRMNDSDKWTGRDKMGNRVPANDFEYFEGLLSSVAVEPEIDDTGGYRVMDGILLVSQFGAFDKNGDEQERKPGMKTDAAELGYERLRRIKAMISLAKVFLMSQDIPADKMDMALDGWAQNLTVLKNDGKTSDKSVFLAFSAKRRFGEWAHEE